MTLNKLKTMRDADIQTFLRKVGGVNASSLGIALLGADEDVRNSVLRNMSKTASAALAEMIRQNQVKGVPAAVVSQHAANLEKLL